MGRRASPTFAGFLFLGLVLTTPVVATPATVATPAIPSSDSEDQPFGASSLRVWACLPAGSFSIVKDLSPRVIFDTGDLVSLTQQMAFVDPDPPFPADAADVQNWIGNPASY
jgi:hypothetical protein